MKIWRRPVPGCRRGLVREADLRGVRQAVRHMDLQDIDAFEGDGLDAGNAHATNLTDGYLPMLWKR
tara:strand:- start:1557 stop:1754 length:198 start_codon:yes stop_codon:yes gene_type:complete